MLVCKLFVISSCNPKTSFSVCVYRLTDDWQAQFKSQPSNLARSTPPPLIRQACLSRATGKELFPFQQAVRDGAIAVLATMIGSLLVLPPKEVLQLAGVQISDVL